MSSNYRLIPELHNQKKWKKKKVNLLAWTKKCAGEDLTKFSPSFIIIRSFVNCFLGEEKIMENGTLNIVK